MLDILSITGVIFALIALGYLTVIWGLFSDGDLAVLGKYIVNLALPALIFNAVASRSLAEVFIPGYVGAYLIGSLAVFAFGYGWSRKTAGLDPIASTFQATGMTCSNSGFVGYPILLMALPDIAAKALAMNMIVENLVMIPMILVLAERATNDGLIARQVARKIARRLMTNPIILALAAGLAVSVTGFTLPAFVSAPVKLIGASSSAVSLIVIGGTLAGLPFGALNRRVVDVALGKLLLHPLAVAGGLAAMAVLGAPLADPMLVQAAILMAAMPAMGFYPILARQYGQQGPAALAMLVMTVLSFPSISFVLWLLTA